MKKRKEDEYTSELFRIGYHKINSLDVNDLPIKPTRCVTCFGLYVRTQGPEQEVCLTCQRDEAKGVKIEVPPYKPREKRLPRIKVMGESDYAIIVEYENEDEIWFD